MMMLGGVPIMVSMPPRMVAKAKGISDEAGERPAFCAACTSTGINMASAATLFMKPENTAPMPPMIEIWSGSERSRLTACRVIRSTAPERDRPAVTTSTKAMMIVASLPKPENAV